jgi:hypothetical protein
LGGGKNKREALQFSKQNVIFASFQVCHIHGFLMPPKLGGKNNCYQCGAKKLMQKFWQYVTQVNKYCLAKSNPLEFFFFAKTSYKTL